MEIYITRNGEDIGPYSRGEAFAQLKDGNLTGEDLAWHEGMEEWKPLKEVLGGLKPLFVPPTAAAPPSPVVVQPAIAAFAPTPAANFNRQPKSKVPPRERGTGGKGRLLVKLALVACIANGAFWSCSHVESVKHWIAQGRETLQSLLPFPESKPEQQGVMTQETPAPVVEPQREEVAEATPEPEQVRVGSAPAEPELDLATLAGSPMLWPKAVVLREKTTFPAVFNGKVMGSSTLPAGAAVNLLSVNGDKVTLEFHKGTVAVPAASTDLLERAREASKRAASSQGTEAPRRSASMSASNPQPVLASAQPRPALPPSSAGGLEELPGLGVQPASYFSQSTR